MPARDPTVVVVPSYALSSLRVSETTDLLAVEKVESWWSVPVTKWRQRPPRLAEC